MAKILLAEDDKFLSNIFCSKLQKEGYEVVQAYDGEEAIEKLKAENFDLILIDLIMPKKDGFEVLAEMQIQGLGKGVKIVVLSNLSQEEDVKKTKEMGVLDYWVKSNLTPQELVVKVKGIMSQ